MKKLCAALVALGLFGCVSTQAPPGVNPTQVAVCDPTAFAPFAVSGSGSIEGQAFLKTRGGDVKLGAGNPVILVPAVDCAIYWWNHGGRNWYAREIFPDSPVFRGSVKTQVSDGEGRFKFTGLAAGQYYVRTLVTWEVPDGRGSMNMQGGLVGSSFSVSAGQTTTAILAELTPP